jgi:hypothetical protein
VAITRTATHIAVAVILRFGRFQSWNLHLEHIDKINYMTFVNSAFIALLCFTVRAMSTRPFESGKAMRARFVHYIVLRIV